MSLFNFLKRNELQRIKELESLLIKYQPVIALDDVILQKELEVSNLQAIIGKFNKMKI